MSFSLLCGSSEWKSERGKHLQVTNQLQCVSGWFFPMIYAGQLKSSIMLDNIATNRIEEVLKYLDRLKTSKDNGSSVRIEIFVWIEIGLKQLPNECIRMSSSRVQYSCDQQLLRLFGAVNFALAPCLQFIYTVCFYHFAGKAFLPFHFSPLSLLSNRSIDWWLAESNAITTSVTIQLLIFMQQKSGN